MRLPRKVHCCPACTSHAERLLQNRPIPQLNKRLQEHKVYVCATQLVGEACMVGPCRFEWVLHCGRGKRRNHVSHASQASTRQLHPKDLLINNTCSWRICAVARRRAKQSCSQAGKREGGGTPACHTRAGPSADVRALVQRVVGAHSCRPYCVLQADLPRPPEQLRHPHPGVQPPL